MNPANLLIAGIIILLISIAIMVILDNRRKGRNSCGCTGCIGCSKGCQCGVARPVEIDDCDSCTECHKTEGENPPLS